MFKVADAHCDYLYCAMEYGFRFNSDENKNNAITLNKLIEGNVAIQFFAVWTDSHLKIPAIIQSQEMIDVYYKLLNDYSEHIADISNNDDSRIKAVLSMEGGEALEGSIASLHNYKRLGVRAMSLTWNDNNELSGAAEGFGNKGLTSFGRDVVSEMNQIHMAVDLAHLSDAGIDNVLKQSIEPVFSSHTNCRKVCNTKRSLPDEYIKEIASKNGLICINFYPKQLRKDYMNASVKDVVTHIMHVVKTAGVDYCGIGSDFDGMPKYPKGISSPCDYSNIATLLKSEGLNDSEIDKILYKNLEQYIHQFV